MFYLMKPKKDSIFEYQINENRTFRFLGTLGITIYHNYIMVTINIVIIIYNYINDNITLH